ncbi:ATP-dependent zinc metalloprotease FtsH [Candidatus Cyrtobacter comes]|uniref:ATP-dependent zinc metalloprotease FtsH n=1 Tax=Candidatus Cyrtobacter comes TaxID=675776 RepID=A0ABU5L826_9RICK|nr:ATP-dependent zinc metalloprotease FtsH [Candidatus Cyrtobacter comes]
MKNLGGKNNLFLWLVIAGAMFIFYDIMGGTEGSSKRIKFSEFLDYVDSGNIRSANLRGDIVEGELSDGRKFSTLSPTIYPNLIDKLRNHGALIEIVPAESSLSYLLSMLLSWFPMLLLIGVWVYFMKGVQSGGGRAMDFGKSKARLLSKDDKKVTFKDVAGIDEAKAELGEIVDYLKNPEKFMKLGGRIPRGCLLVGPPGNGKTLLAKAIAGEASVPFLSISGSDFVEMFVGVGASRVRDMFTQAKKHAPCILFIDEIDAVGRQRAGGSGFNLGNDEREQTLNQLLVEMDGFSDNSNVIVLAATNRAEVLDKALLRPGRFDRQVIIPLPDVNGRERILYVHSRDIPFSPDVKLNNIARGTPGFSGAELKNLINEAALNAARHNQNLVTMSDLAFAKDKVIIGSERRSLAISDEEKKIIAYHEGGHALVAMLTAAADKPEKATIIPTSKGALGVTLMLPERDVLLASDEALRSHISVAMGGRVAEELIFGKNKITTGASNDLKVATSTARAMVTRWGLSDDIGPVFIDDSQGHFGSNIISDELAKRIDSETRKILSNGYEEARRILTENIVALEAIANALLEYEVISGDEIKSLIRGEKIRVGMKDTKVDIGDSTSVPGSSQNDSINGTKKVNRAHGDGAELVT